MGEFIRSDFLMIFGAEKSNLKKITYRGDLKLICLNPFLDSLGHFGLKNIGLPLEQDRDVFRALRT